MKFSTLYFILLFELIKYTATKQELNYLANLFKKKSYNNKEIFNNIYSTIKSIINKINDYIFQLLHL